MKNKNNIQSAQTFNPPTVHEDATNGGKCYVFDPAAWRNRNRQTAEGPAPKKHAAPEKKSAPTFSRDNGSGGFIL